jgi:hypothetical protein
VHKRHRQSGVNVIKLFTLAPDDGDKRLKPLTLLALSNVFQYRLERLARDKQYSLFGHFVSDEDIFYNIIKKCK